MNAIWSRLLRRKTSCGFVVPAFEIQLGVTYQSTTHLRVRLPGNVSPLIVSLYQRVRFSVFLKRSTWRPFFQYAPTYTVFRKSMCTKASSPATEVPNLGIIQGIISLRGPRCTSHLCRQSKHEAWVRLRGIRYYTCKGNSFFYQTCTAHSFIHP